MPLSITRNVTQSLDPTVSRQPSRMIFPCFVNFAALDRRLNRLWRSLVRSVCIAPVVSGQRTSSRFSFFSTSGCTVLATSLTTEHTSTSSRYSSIRPDSIFDKSRMSFTSASR
jgi:hypothetical protein